MDGRPTRGGHRRPRLPHRSEAAAPGQHRTLAWLCVVTRHRAIDLLRKRKPPAVAWLFDLLLIDGKDLRRLPWMERRAQLERLMARNKSPLLQLNEVWEDGPGLLRAIGEQGLEGIVSKHRSAPYRSGHTDAWVKVKVLGWSEANRRRFKR